MSDPLQPSHSEPLGTYVEERAGIGQSNQSGGIMIEQPEIVRHMLGQGDQPCCQHCHRLILGGGKHRDDCPLQKIRPSVIADEQEIAKKTLHKGANKQRIFKKPHGTPRKSATCVRNRKRGKKDPLREIRYCGACGREGLHRRIFKRWVCMGCHG